MIFKQMNLSAILYHCVEIVPFLVRAEYNYGGIVHSRMLC